MFLLSKGALALSLVLSASASELVSRSRSTNPNHREDHFNLPSYEPMPRQATASILVAYSDELAHLEIKGHILERSSKGLHLSESNIPMAKAHKVRSRRSGKAGKGPQNRLLEDDDSLVLVRGISIVSVPNDRDIITAEISALSAIPGVEAVEDDEQMTVFSIKDQQKLRGGKGTVDHISDINSALKTTAEQLALANEKAPIAHSDQVQGRRLSEEVPYGITMVKATSLLDKVPVGPTEPVKICVVDTGYDDGHDDLPTSAANGVIGFDGYGQSWHVDGNGHGTHCAGTIGAIGSNNEGVTSVNPDPSKFQFLIGKGLSNSGGGSNSGVMAAVENCVQNGAKVISMSLGGGGYSTISNAAYEDYYDRGVLIIAAAGNDGSSSKSYPASYPTVLSVAAVGENRIKAGFSQYNNQVELAGPGVDVKSTLPRDDENNPTYDSWSGTSMAAPHVAGVAAYLMYLFPSCTNHQIRNVMLRSAADEGNEGYDVNYGWGIVDAESAYNLLEQGGCEEGGPATAPEGQELHDLAPGGEDQLDPLYDHIDCDDGNQCTIDSFNPLAGTCQHTQRVCNGPFYSGACDPETGCVIGDCVDNMKRLVVDITIDNYGQETTYKVENMCANEQVFFGGPYNANEISSDGKCLPDGRYKFIITDEYGDGICCSYGSGGYILKWDGVEVASGGDFGASETHEFGLVSCDGTSPTVGPTPSPTYSLVPTSHPTNAPTSHPTNASTNKFLCSSASEEPTNAQICAEGSKCEDEVCPFCLGTCWFASCVSDNDNTQAISTESLSWQMTGLKLGSTSGVIPDKGTKHDISLKGTKHDKNFRDNDGDLMDIDIMSNNFVGTIPANIGQVDMSNNFVGTIPANIGQVDTIGSVLKYVCADKKPFDEVICSSGKTTCDKCKHKCHSADCDEAYDNVNAGERLGRKN